MKKQKKKTIWVDFQLIKEKVTVRQVVEYYGIELTKKPDGRLVGVCPLHGTPEHPADNPAAFTVSADGKAWKCFTRCQDPAGGNVLDFVMKKEGVSLRRAGELLTEWFLLDTAPNKTTKADTVKETAKHYERPRVKPVNEPLDFELRLKKDVPFLLEEKGLTLKIVKKFGLGYCAKGMHAGRIVIPIHNEQGKLVAYAGRSLKRSDTEHGKKYHFPANFYKHVELFNLHRVINIPKLVGKGGIILVEGFFDAIKLWQNGVYNAVALMGTSLSEWQEELLLEYTDKVTLLLDNNKAGQEATDKINQRLSGICFVKTPQYPENVDQPERLSKEQLQDMLGLEANKNAARDQTSGAK